MSRMNPLGILANTIPGARSHSPVDLSAVGITDAQAMALAVKAGEISKAHYGDSIPDTAADITADIVDRAASRPRWRKVTRAAVLASVAMDEIETCGTKRTHFERLADESPFDGMAPVSDHRPGNEAAHKVLSAILAA